MPLAGTGGIGAAARGAAMGSSISPGMGSIIGAGIGAAGSLLSGRGGSNVGPKEYKDAAYGTIKGKVRAAKEFGLHPLFALGTSTPGPMQAIPGQSNLGSAAKEVGMGIANATAASHAARLQSAQTDLIKAQTRVANAEAARILKDFNTTPTGSQVGTPTQTPAAALASPIGGVTPGPHATAERMEEEYGGAVGEVHGASRYARDRAYRVTAGQRHPHKTSYSDPVRYHSRKYRSRSGRNARNAGRWRY